MIKKCKNDKKMQRKYEYKTFSKNENLKQEDFLKFKSPFHITFAPMVQVQDKNNFQQKKIFKKNRLQKKEN